MSLQNDFMRPRSAALHGTYRCIPFLTNNLLDSPHIVGTRVILSLMKSCAANFPYSIIIRLSVKFLILCSLNSVRIPQYSVCTASNLSSGFLVTRKKSTLLLEAAPCTGTLTRTLWIENFMGSMHRQRSESGSMRKI